MDAPDPDPRDPLAQPTAARLFALLSSARRRLSTDELAHRADLHPNSARLHLSRLYEAGLIERAAASSGRGRPHYEWRISPRARVSGERPVAYRELAAWLSRSITARGGDLREIEAAGERIGAEIAPMTGRGDAAEVLGEALSAMGFQPRARTDGRRTTFTLANCPYRDVAKTNPGVVCTLHRGIARGLLANARPKAELARFVAQDPETAGCVIEIEEFAEVAREETGGKVHA